MGCLDRVLYRTPLLIALIGLTWSSTTFGQQEADESAALEMEEVVVVGTRAEPRSVTDSTVPVDVISNEAFDSQAGSDMSNLIRSVVPSFHMSDNPSRDLAALLRPVNLRGLAPDHTLVLMNNKRRHRGSVIQWISNGASNGAQGPDISAIPSIAIRQLEVLRDGAAAQYGSDAIAGVLNFQLKDAPSGSDILVKYGGHSENEEETFMSVAGNIGLPLFDSGFANLSLEYGTSEPTNRSVQHGDATALIQQGVEGVRVPAKPWGSPDVKSNIKFVANLGNNVGEDGHFYAFGNYAEREVETFFFFRSPMNRVGVYKTGDNHFLVGGEGCQAKYNVPAVAENVLSFRDTLRADQGCFWFGEILPQGFTPRFGAVVSDLSGVVGYRKIILDDIDLDLSASTGYNRMNGFINDTLNPSLGPTSPRDFNFGEYRQKEWNVNVDASKVVQVLDGNDLNVAGGLEVRNEEFSIDIGERSSWAIGHYQQYGFSTGTNGFGGFNPASSGAWNRLNTAAYLDLELAMSDNAVYGGALRLEDFDGFGTTLNFKLTGRIDVSDTLAVRGSVGTGFRAPTPGQSNARNVSTVVNAATNVFEERGTIGSTHPVAVALGGRELEPEESVNFTAGAILELDNGITVTADFFSIDVTDRIALSGLTTVTDEIKTALVEQGVPEAADFTSVRFFTNDFDTSTRGIDIVATQSMELGDGVLDVLFSFNNTQTSVEDYREGSTITGGDTIDNLERGAPETRYGISARYSLERIDLTARYNFYGSWYDDHSAAEFDGYGYVDLLGTLVVTDQISVSAGIENAFDAYPDETISYGNGRLYPRYSPAGYNGTLVYVSTKLSF
ncbi:MAG: TonB-dependent receptor [Gammaproteobacteria bacterium]|nr:TonB-dependent receptor [Gammaproteobacteria bacterium]